MCVTAHPDDEAWAFGGSLARYQQRGVETWLICLTRGGAGTHKGKARNSEEQKAIRAQEFEAACRSLEVTHPVLLDYPDGGLAGLNFLEVVADLSQRIRVAKPEVIITFGTDGTVTAHPDHSMVALFATAAYHWAGRSNRFPEQLRRGLQPHRTEKLYYLTTLDTWPERPPIAPAPITNTIDVLEYVQKKMTAFKAHASQAPLLPGYERVLLALYEYYHLAASRALRGTESETDLFTGVQG